MPQGKPAGVPCVNLNSNNLCTVYDIRPKVCRDFMPDPECCGSSFEEAIVLLGQLERATQ
jgi:Fe-S-cluster containining protein